MKFKLLIEPKKEELVQAQVHQENEFTNKLKLFVLTNGNSNQIAAYDDKDLIALSLDQIVLITIRLSTIRFGLFAAIIRNTKYENEFIS